MRAGKLDRTITISRPVESVSAGKVTTSWQIVGKLRAEIVNLGATESTAAFGDQQTDAIVFRTRYLAGLSTKDSVEFDGTRYNLKGIVEIGRRRGLELRCERTT